MSLIQDVKLALFWSILCKFTGQLITWSFTLIVIRILKPEDYGSMAIAASCLNILIMINSMGFAASIIQDKEITIYKQRQIFGLSIATNIIAFIVIFYTSPLIAIFFEAPILVDLLRLLSIQFIFIGFTIIPNAILERDLRFKEVSIITLASNVIGSAITLALALAGYGVWSLAIGTLSIVCMRSIMLNIIHPHSYLPVFSVSGMRKIVLFGGSITLQRIGWMIYSQADTFIIAKLFNKHQLGQYSVAHTIAALPMQKLNAIISAVAFPSFSSIQNDRNTLNYYLNKSIRIVSITMFPVFAGISSIAPELVLVVLGDKWLAATRPIQILCWVMPFRMQFSIYTTALNSIGRADLALKATMGLVITIPTAIYIGSQWSIEAVCWAWVITFPLIITIAYSMTKTHLGIDGWMFWSIQLTPLIVGISMFIMINELRIFFFKDEASLLSLTFLVVSGSFFYITIIFITARSSLIEILNIFRSKKDTQ